LELQGQTEVVVFEKDVTDNGILDLCTESSVASTDALWRLRMYYLSSCKAVQETDFEISLISEPVHVFGAPMLPYTPKAFKALVNHWHMSGSCLSNASWPGARRFTPKDEASTKKGEWKRCEKIVAILVCIGYDFRSKVIPNFSDLHSFAVYTRCYRRTSHIDVR
jgi:hypothetical protein